MQSEFFVGFSFSPLVESFAVTQSLPMGCWILSLQGALPSLACMFCLEMRTWVSGVFFRWQTVLLSDWRLTRESLVPCRCWEKVSIQKGLMRPIHISVSPSLPLVIFPVGNLTPYYEVPLYQLQKQTALKLVCWLMDAVLAAEFNIPYRQHVFSSGWYLLRGWTTVKAETKSHKVNCVAEACSVFFWYQGQIWLLVMQS